MEHVLNWNPMSLKVRRAHPDDWPNIEALIRSAHRAFVQLEWWEEYLTDNLFVVIEREGILAGALLAWPDESPVAWVRLAVLDDSLNTGEWLDLALPPLLDELRHQATRTVAWMDPGGWAGYYLMARGFEPFVEVMTLIKSDHALPRVDAASARVRTALDVDVPAIVAVDRAAFAPHWWHSEMTMRRIASTSDSIFVAEREGEVVGYAGGKLHSATAHLHRIAVHPDHQGCGVGALLLHDISRAFWQEGARQITLNTQTDNRSSQRLYRRFVFEPTGESMMAWELQLDRQKGGTNAQTIS